MLKKYFDILQLPESASVADISKAYRIRAKMLHPDINPHPDAHRQFILLNEAYQILIKHKKNPTQYHSGNYNFWWEEERRKANTEAEQQAQMQYKEYLKSDHYRYLNSINILLDHFGMLAATVFPVGLPILFFNWYGWKGLITALVLVAFFSPYILEGWSLRKKFNRQLLQEALIFLWRYEHFQIFLFVLINLVLFWNYALVTLINFSSIILLYLLSGLICTALWFFYFKSKMKMSLLILLLAIAPMISNFLFITNFYVSKNESPEEYHFVMQPGSVMQLDNDAYANETFIRFFPDPDKTKPFSRIRFNFAHGMYGWRVLRNYELLE
jgi:DnaJ domain